VSDVLNVGIIGLRFGVQMHLPAFRSDERCRVVGVAGRDRESAERVARDLGVPKSFTDWQDLVSDREVDAIGIAVPPLVQPVVIAEAARHGKHVFCEKPLAASLPEARRAVECAQAAQIAHGVDFIFPELAAWKKARHLLMDGAIGRTVHFSYSWRVETYASRTNALTWKSRPEAGGGVLGNILSHVLYNVEWLFGPINAIEGFVCSRDSRHGRAMDGVVEIESGIRGAISVCTDAFLGSGHVVEIFGENGTVVLRNAGVDYVAGFDVSVGTRASGTLSVVPTGPEVTSAGDGRVVPVSRLVRRFIDAILGGEPMTPNLSHGVRVQELLALIAESADSVRQSADGRVSVGS